MGCWFQLEHDISRRNDLLLFHKLLSPTAAIILTFFSLSPPFVQLSFCLSSFSYFSPSPFPLPPASLLLQFLLLLLFSSASCFSSPLCSSASLSSFLLLIFLSSSCFSSPHPASLLTLTPPPPHPFSSFLLLLRLLFLSSSPFPLLLLLLLLLRNLSVTWIISTHTTWIYETTLT